MSKLHNHRYPPGLEREILRKIPKYFLASILIPLFMAIFVRMPLIERQFAGSAEEVARLHSTIDFLSIAIFVSLLPVFVTVVIGCIVVILMKGPAYIADGYEVNDADEPDESDKHD